MLSLPGKPKTSTIPPVEAEQHVVGPHLVHGGDPTAASRDAGWSKVRHASSHVTWQSADGTRLITIAGKDSDTVPAGTLAAMRRATGLDDLR